MKLKKAVVLCLCVWLTAAFGGDAFAYDLPGRVRVGLSGRHKNVGSVAVGNKALLVGYEANGALQGEVIAANSAFTVVPTDLFYVSQGQNLGSYAMAAQQAAAYASSGQKCVVAFLGTGNWQVYFGGYGTKAEADAARDALGGQVVGGGGRTALKDGQQEAIVFDNANGAVQVADANGGFVTIGDRKYRSSVEFGRYTGGLLTAVNVLTLDEYLFSVVPSEMPASWHIEALKAQAVAARGYAVTRMGVHAADGYDLCDTVHCQNYLGAGNEAQSTTKAINETSGVMAYYGGKPINATYFSSSGGVTEDGDKVWSNSIPYLKSVPEVAENTCKQWTRSFTMAEITTLLQANGADIGQAVSVSTASDSVSGRVTILTITGTKGAKTYTKDSVRTFFSKSGGGSLESTNFVIAGGAAAAVAPGSGAVSVTNGTATQQVPVPDLFAVTDTSGLQKVSGSPVVQGKDSAAAYGDGRQPVTAAATGSGNTVVFVGKGWGHGAGMSQYGAKGMAEAGYTYDRILKHYYTGIEVK